MKDFTFEEELPPLKKEEIIKVKFKIKNSLDIARASKYIKISEDNFKELTVTEFVNKISIPSIDIFRQYWKSNIYYDSTYDSKFEHYAKQHFNKFPSFEYSKKAALITMQTPLV